MALRRQWQPRIDAGAITCARCHLPIVSGQAWDLGHTVDRALGGHGSEVLPEHARCNRRAGGQLGQALRTQPVVKPVPLRITTRRAWL